jgi:hypothetical protein
VTVADYSYLDHVETEFLGDEEVYGPEADSILAGFFRRRKGAQSRAFTEDSLRYIIVPDGGDMKIIEEEGEWDPGDVEPEPDNVYEIITEEDGRIRHEEVSAQEAEAYLL